MFFLNLFFAIQWIFNRHFLSDDDEDDKDDNNQQIYSSRYAQTIKLLLEFT